MKITRTGILISRNDRRQFSTTYKVAMFVFVIMGFNYLNGKIRDLQQQVWDTQQEISDYIEPHREPGHTVEDRADGRVEDRPLYSNPKGNRS